MNKVTRASIERLMQQPLTTPVVSLYMPTHRAPTPPHIQEDQTRFKNLLREAKAQWQILTNKEVSSEIKSQFEALLDDQLFWQQTTEGLAIFITPGQYIEIFHLPMECEEHITIGDNFDVAPLLVLQAYDQPYYMLRIAMHDASLLKGDMYGLEPVAIDFPKSPEDALNIDEMFSGSNTIRTNGGPAGSRNTTSPHGAGDSQGAGTEERLQYFRIIDNMIITSRDYDSSLPIIIAGTDNEAGDFCKLTKMNHVVTEHIQGNHSATALRELHDMAWPLICKHVTEERAKSTVQRYQESIAASKSSDDQQAIDEAARQGRVDTLFVRMIRRTRDSISDAVHHESPILTFGSGSEQAHIAQLVRNVFNQGGKILGLEPDLMPAKVPVAAIYRY